MKKNQVTMYLVFAGILSLLFAATHSFVNILKSFIPSVEGFIPSPVWDVKQWTWGYGTAAGYDHNKKPTGTITREKAWQEAVKVIQGLYNQLKGHLQKKLNSNQEAALLSFTYNVGPGNGLKIVDTINTGTTADVVARMKKYVYADGKYNQGLMNRRIKETNLYQGIGTMGMAAAAAMPEFLERIHPDRITDFAY